MEISGGLLLSIIHCPLSIQPVITEALNPSYRGTKPVIARHEAIFLQVFQALLFVQKVHYPGTYNKKSPPFLVGQLLVFLCKHSHFCSTFLRHFSNSSTLFIMPVTSTSAISFRSSTVVNLRSICPFPVNSHSIFKSG